MSHENSSCQSLRYLPLLATVIGVCLIFAALVWVTKKYTTPPDINAARIAERAKARVELTTLEAEGLQTVGYADPVRGIVRLPIAEAMKIAEREWQHPAQARSNLLARVAKANAPLPKAPEKPSIYE